MDFHSFFAPKTREASDDITHICRQKALTVLRVDPSVGVDVPYASVSNFFAPFTGFLGVFTWEPPGADTECPEMKDEGSTRPGVVQGTLVPSVASDAARSF